MATEQDSDAQKKLAEDLYQAVRSDDVTKVRSLLGQGADPNQQLYWSDEWAEKLPPLHWACLRGYLEIVKTLVTHGAHTEDLKDVDNWTSLHNACCSGHKDVVQYLVEKANCDISVTDDDGETPLDFATQAGHTEIADYLKSLPQQSAVTGDTDSRSDENGPPPTKKRKSGQPVTLRVCPNCEESCHIRCKKCPECEHEFPPSTKSRAKPDQDIVKNPSNLLQILQKKVDQLSLLGFDIVVLVHRDSSKSHDSSTTSHDTPSRSRHTYRKFVTSGLAESFVESPLVYGSWKDFCSSDKTSTGHAQKSKNKTNPRKKKGVQTNTNTTTQEGDRSHDTSGVSHDQSNVSQDSNGPNTQSQTAQSSTAPLSISDLTPLLTPLWNTISSLRQQVESMQSAPPTHGSQAYPQHMYPSATGLMSTGQSTFVPGGGSFNTPLPNHFTGPSSHSSMLGQSSRFNLNPVSFPMFPFSPAPANYRFPSPIIPLESSRQPMNSDPNTDSIDSQQ
ncbi:uncharacterized protein LOC135331159 isoform X1 [Halichondria panicea]|uniref:uncharacterized protein LOC135331159 isoform X1 n=1 Tax=Halichondria panicea TaxID=6063 RepID=UPI00312BA70C